MSRDTYADRRASGTARFHGYRQAGLDHIYLVPGALVHTSLRPAEKTTSCSYASIAIAADHHPFELKVDGYSAYCAAAAIKPLVSSEKKRINGPLVTVHLEPLHSRFHVFRALSRPGVLPLDRALFAQSDRELAAVCHGRLQLEDAVSLVGRIVEIVVAPLSGRNRHSARQAKLRELVISQPTLSLSEIAAALGLSYDRTSHLFAEAFGLPFRSYRLWLKVWRATHLLWSGESLTTTAHRAGFADSAHLCRAYQQMFGRTPSYFADHRHADRVHQLPVVELNSDAVA